MSRAHADVTIDDDRVRVTTWTFEGRGDDTGQHVHEYDYVVVPVTGGLFRVTTADGAARDMVQESGTPYLGTAGTAHVVASVQAEPATFVEIELKGRAGHDPAAAFRSK